ncbi:MAG: CoA transferase [Planctomycetes bacterium]|nr:CoA transferase [Planctomycetota bacterium]
MKPITVLSLEQALSLPSGTARFVHEGSRVIRLEATPRGKGRPGDPNRYVGPPVDHADRHAYFFGPNAGKEAITLNLRTGRGRELLLDLIRKLPVDVFAINTLPRRYEELGVDYETLSAARPQLIWVGISAYGPGFPSAPGYDPALQAELGYMDVTGDPAGTPTLCGVPMVDLKAGDEMFAQVCLALAERAEAGRGKRIDISMAQAATSWLMTMIPLLDLGTSGVPVGRFGNEHREFVPVNVYPCQGGHLYLAIGSDAQWDRLCSLPLFAALHRPERNTNEGRADDREAIHAELAGVTAARPLDELLGLLRDAGLVVAPVNPVSRVRDLDTIAPHLLRTQRASGVPLHLAPPAVDTPHLDSLDHELNPPPRYGEHTQPILSEIGLDSSEIQRLLEDGVAFFGAEV